MANNLVKGSGCGTREWREDFVLTDTDQNTTLFSVAKASGNTTVAGTLAVTGAATLTAGLKSASGQHLTLNSGTTNTDQAGKTDRLNSITNTGTANEWIGFQSKPAQGASMANNVIGAEISPRLNDTFALSSSGTLIGLHVDTYLKGTTGNVGGDVRGMQVEMVTDDAGTRTVTGNVVGLRFRTAWSGTISGKMIAVRIEKPETQTNSKTYDYVLDLTSTNGTVWADDFTNEVTTIAGAIKVRVNGSDRWIPLYSGAPS